MCIALCAVCILLGCLFLDWLLVSVVRNCACVCCASVQVSAMCMCMCLLYYVRVAAAVCAGKLGFPLVGRPGPPHAPCWTSSTPQSSSSPPWWWTRWWWTRTPPSSKRSPYAGSWPSSTSSPTASRNTSSIVPHAYMYQSMKDIVHAIQCINMKPININIYTSRNWLDLDCLCWIVDSKCEYWKVDIESTRKCINMHCMCFQSKEADSIICTLENTCILLQTGHWAPKTGICTKPHYTYWMLSSRQIFTAT